MKKTETKHQRRTEAIYRRENMGLKVDNTRDEDIIRRAGLVDENGRLPSTVRPYRGRHHDSDDRSLGKRVKALAVGSVAVVGLGLGTGALYGEGEELPKPADHLPADVTYIDGDLQLKNQNPNNGISIGYQEQEK